MSVLEEEVREGSSPLPEQQAADPARRGAQRAKSLTLPSLSALKPVTQRVRSAGASAAAAANTRDSLLHAQAPTFAANWAAHQQAFARYEALLLKLPRQAWAAFHAFLLKPLLNGIEWVTFSPPRFFTAVAIIAAIWIWG